MRSHPWSGGLVSTGTDDNSSGNIIRSTDNFQAFWKTVAGEFASNKKVIFDTSKPSSPAQSSPNPSPSLSANRTDNSPQPDNEYHDMPQTLVKTLNQAAINGIRASGAKTQPIFIEGNSYTGAWKWTTENDNLKTLTDPSDNLVYEMHQYLDSDGSGTAAECVSASIGRERVQKATQWLKTNGKKGFLGEFGGGVNTQCQEAVNGMLQYMQANSDVWMGAGWWAAGPWWGEEYMYNLEPTDGKAYAVYLPILKKFFPSSSSSSSSSFPSSSGTASAAASTAQVIRSPSSPASSSGAGASGSTIPVHVPTTMATSAAASSLSVTLVASSSSASPSSSGISSAFTPAASSSGGVARRFA